MTAGGVVIQSGGINDRKIVVGGTCGTATVVLARFLPDGTLDATFGTNGLVLSPGDAASKALLVQPDNKLVTVGFQLIPGSNQALVARYNEDGSPDPSFGANGVVTTTTGEGKSSFRSVARQPDGKIVAVGQGGSTAPFAAPKGKVVRFETNGTIDTSFGLNGVFTTIGPRSFSAVAMESDGRIVAAGGTVGINSSCFHAMRLSPNGVADSSLDDIECFASASDFDGIKSVLIQPDMKILVGGITVNSSGPAGLVRYTSTGARDGTFDSEGVLTTSAFPEASALGFTALSKILVATGLGGQVLPLSLARLNDDGSPDSAFGTGGIAPSPISGGGTTSGLAIDAFDGSVIVAGTVHSDFALVRYVGDVPTVLHVR